MKAIETKDGLILEVLVKTRSKAFGINVEKDEILVLCMEEPTKGKANREIVKEFSRVFHKRVELVSGFSSRQKKLLIKDAKKGDVDFILQRRKAQP
jgi:uncharacterized protein (TIGR00251 family)